MKRSRFYCENCAAEVKATARVCPACGRFFSAVRCPQCLYTDEARMFTFGCPKCGYASGNASGTAAAGAGDWEIVGDVSGDDSRLRRGRRYYRAREIPGWVWHLTAAILTVIFAILVIIYINL